MKKKKSVFIAFALVFIIAAELFGLIHQNNKKKNKIYVQNATDNYDISLKNNSNEISGITVSDLHVTKKSDGTYIEGTIENVSEEVINVGKVTFELLDEKDTKILVFELVFDTIEPGNTINFQTGTESDIDYIYSYRVYR